MEQLNSTREIVNRLQKEILHLQGIKTPSSAAIRTFGLGPIEAAFPNSVFPTGALHEFINHAPEHAAASGAFIAGLLQTLMQQGAACLWIGTSRTLFPPSLTAFGVAPDRIIFIDLKKEKDVLWATEEALKCEGLAAVIAEVQDMSLTQSRRLQLAAEKSGVTGMILRNQASKMMTTACVARWQIRPISSAAEDGMPGVGLPRWEVSLLKVRNGNPGQWEIEWAASGFHPVTAHDVAHLRPIHPLKTGS